MTTAKPFTLLDQDENKVSLSDFKGRMVVLYFYPEADTPGCTTQACDIRDHITDITKAGAMVLGVSADEPKKLKKFQEKYHLNFPLLSDPKHKTLEAYGVWKEKQFMGNKYMGIERTTFLIDEKGEIIRTYEKVNPTTHADIILADLHHAPLRAAKK